MVASFFSLAARTSISNDDLLYFRPCFRFRRIRFALNWSVGVEHGCHFERCSGGVRFWLAGEGGEPAEEYDGGGQYKTQIAVVSRLERCDYMMMIFLGEGFARNGVMRETLLRREFDCILCMCE